MRFGYFVIASLVVFEALVLCVGVDSIRQSSTALVDGAWEKVDWNQLVSAAFGALLGATASGYATSRQMKFTLRRENEREEMQRLKETRANIYKTSIKLSIFINGYLSVYLSISRSLREYADRPKLYLRLVPMIGLSPVAMRFEAEELVPFMEKKNADLINDILLFVERYASTVDNYLEYMRMREDYLTKNFAKIEQNPALTDAIMLEMQDENMPQVRNLEQLAVSLWSAIQEDKLSAVQLSDDFTKVARVILNDETYNGLQSELNRFEEEGQRSR